MNLRLLNFRLLISNETRQEFLTSVTLAIIAIADLFFLLITTIYFYTSGDASGFPYFILLGVASGIGWYFSRIGLWRWVRRFPTVLFFLLGIYGSFEKGFSTYFIAFYILAFMLAGLLVNKYEMLLFAFAGILVHTTIAWSSAYPEGIIVLTAQFTGVTLLQWIYAIITENIIRHSLLDPLTQVNNRGYFDATLAVLQNSRQYPISIVVVDMDGLKNFNDTLGHTHGDIMIVRTSQCLRKAVRTEDTLCRIGGDEFGIILTKTDEQSAVKIAERISNEIETNNRENPELPLRLSIGMATATLPNHLIETYKKADEFMYKEKRKKTHFTVTGFDKTAFT